MTSDIIQDRGRGPEIAGTRITVHNLLPSFLDPTMTEAELCRIHDLTALQVAAARAYIFCHADVVLAEHLKIEDRLAVGNPPEVRERAGRAKETLQRFKRWLEERECADKLEEPQGGAPSRFPTFREWLATHNGR